MKPAMTDMRASVVAAVACLTATVFLALVPFLALPVCAAALTDMSLSGKSVTAAFVAGGAAAIAAIVWGPAGAMMAIVGLAGVLGAIAWLDKGSPWVAVGALAVWYTATFLLIDAVSAMMAGDTFIEGMRGVSQANGALAAGLAGVAGTQSSGVDASSVSETLFMLWPAGYAATGIVSAAFVVAAASRVSRSRGASRQTLPPLAEIDLTPHILWLPVLSAVCLVGARFVDAQAQTLTAMGLNLLVTSWPLFAWQGLAVAAGTLRRLGAKPVARGVVYASLLLVEVLVFAVSIVGFIDIVANFRKLDRTDEMSSRGVGDKASST
jgi:hypothetical protein